MLDGGVSALGVVGGGGERGGERGSALLWKCKRGLISPPSPGLHSLFPYALERHTSATALPAVDPPPCARHNRGSPPP